MATFDDERISKLLRGRREIRRLPFPGLDDLDVGIRVLLDDETDNARLSAAAYVKKRGGDVSIDPELLDRAIQREILALACIDPESPADQPRAFFASAEDVRKLDSSTVVTLWQAYLAHLDYMTPLRRLGESEVAELVEALGKGPEKLGLLSALDAVTLRRCVISMASLLAKSPTSK